jgi:hypothetical protein
MYKAHYINPLIQYGRIDFTLVIEDDEGIVPTYRLEKSFLESVTAEELDQIAAQEIERILAEQELPNAESSNSADVDLPENVELGKE